MNIDENDTQIFELSDNKDMNAYIHELHDDLKLTNVNLKQKSLSVSVIRVKWLNLYFKEKENLKRAIDYKTQILKEKGVNSQSSVLKMKSDDVISGSDERIVKLNKRIDIIKTNIDFLERAQNILNDFGFQIKNHTDILKLESI